MKNEKSTTASGCFVSRRSARSLTWLSALVLATTFTMSARAVDITIGRLYEPDLVALMKELAIEYQAAHPGMAITVLENEAEQDLTTYRQAVGELPDIFTLAVHTYKRVHELPYCVSEGLIVPVEDLGGDRFIAESDHFPSFWPCIEFRDKHWGVPYYAESYGMLMRRKFVPPEVWDKPPATWEELKAVTASLSKDENADGTPEIWGMATQTAEDLPGLWALLAAQLGEKFSDAERFTVAANAGLLQAYGLLAELRDAKALKPPPGGQCGFTYVQSWQLNDELVRTSNFPRQYWSRSPEYKVVALPGVGNGGAMPILNVYLAVKKTTPEKQAACWAFVRWATSPDPQTRLAVVKRGFLPIHESVAAGAAFQERVRKMPHLAVFVGTLKKVIPVFPHAAGGNEAFVALGQAFRRAFDGAVPIEEALVQADRQMNQLGRPAR